MRRHPDYSVDCRRCLHNLTLLVFLCPVRPTPQTARATRPALPPASSANGTPGAPGWMGSASAADLAFQRLSAQSDADSGRHHADGNPWADLTAGWVDAQRSTYRSKAWMVTHPTCILNEAGPMCDADPGEIPRRTLDHLKLTSPDRVRDPGVLVALFRFRSRCVLSHCSSGWKRSVWWRGPDALQAGRKPGCTRTNPRRRPPPPRVERAARANRS